MNESYRLLHSHHQHVVAIRLDDFKKEREFKSILSEITLQDVKEAIRRSDVIIRSLEQDGYRKREYKGYEYYHENPSLSLHDVVSKILIESGLI